ncbi:vWA domain-containing protein [Neptunomonas qingdaonensis]|uniref:Ca-activated chloride channel family protein n=1 Tax=Neptunomonas qingdaonensis TaxID=1045558 RepID=A0A1I2VAW0_9GAMM|nr:VWA domain-containing protein [Neptunomonas qingdaonensis]SFG86300.1 Ca-activated chloride channel family protein [Neptunomonas qingdaonensis]
MFDVALPWLLLLAPLPWLVRWLVPAAQHSKQSALQVPFIESMEQAVGRSTSITQRSNFWITLIAYLAWCLLLVAAARPQWLGEPVAQQREGRDMMLAIDLSESMLEEDFELGGRLINRLIATKVVAGDFIERRKGDRIGLILFGEQAYLQAPLTRDRKTVKQLLDEAQIGLAGKRTAIGDAIGLAVKRFKEMDNEQRILVLITDGTNTAGSIEPDKATELAAAEGLKIYTIGIGRDRTQQGLISQFFGGGTSEIDEATLQYIAENTGGRYFRARDLEQLSEIYSLLNELEPIGQDDDFYRPVVSLYQWPLLGGIFLLCLTGLLQRRRS